MIDSCLGLGLGTGLAIVFVEVVVNNGKFPRVESRGKMSYIRLERDDSVSSFKDGCIGVGRVLLDVRRIPTAKS